MKDKKPAAAFGSATQDRQPAPPPPAPEGETSEVKKSGVKSRIEEYGLETIFF